jgi:hypothetical protein
MRLALPAVLLAVAAQTGSTYVAVDAAYVPAKVRGGDAAVAVTFTPTEAGIVVNETPAPRLKLDAEQTILIDKQVPKPAGGPPPDPEHARYLDPAVPVRFPVALASGAPRGTHRVKGTVTYFFCSKREGWCRKGTADVVLTVAVP